MLKLIGLGLFDEKDLSIREIEEIKDSDRVFIEQYTGKWFGSLENIEKMTGKKIEILSRSEMEENSSRILEMAKQQRVSILSQGDPLVFTTHSSLLTQARKQGIETKIIHNSSIYSAVAESGLHLYKLGGSATIPFPEKTQGKLPESVYDVIRINKKSGLHTLLLLDIDNGKTLSIKNAIETLLKIEDFRKEDVFTSNSDLVLFSTGTEKFLQFGKVKEFLKNELPEMNAVLIALGNLHFTEKEFLNSYAI